jgi:hypothetical protein
MAVRTNGKTLFTGLLAMLLLSTPVMAQRCIEEAMGPLNESQREVLAYARQAELHDAHQLLAERVYVADVRTAGFPARCGERGLFTRLHAEYEKVALRYVEQVKQREARRKRPQYGQVLKVYVRAGAYRQGSAYIQELVDGDKLESGQIKDLDRVIEQRLNHLKAMKSKFFLVRNEPQELNHWQAYRSKLASLESELEAAEKQREQELAQQFRSNPGAAMAGSFSDEDAAAMKELSPEAFGKMQEMMQRMQQQ